MLKQRLSTLSSSRLGETRSPKRDGLSPKPKTLRLSNSLEQKRGTSPCKSRLGEPDSLEQELQTLALFQAQTPAPETKAHSNSYQFSCDYIVPTLRAQFLHNIGPNPKFA